MPTQVNIIVFKTSLKTSFWKNPYISPFSHTIKSQRIFLKATTYFSSSAYYTVISKPHISPETKPSQV